MRTVAFVLSCLACAGHARRLQTAVEPAPDSLEALTALLASQNPEVGYQVSGAGLTNDRTANNIRSSSPAQMMARRSSSPAQMMARRGRRKAFDPELYPGVQKPTGFWDPLGFCEDGDEEAFLRRRGVELKHGRVAMLACLGYIAPYFVRLPGSLTIDGSVKFADVPVGIKALSVIPPLGIVQIFALGGFLEFGPFRNNPEFPGDFGWDPLNLKPKNPAEFLQKKNAELANGRLAMFASLGFIASDIISDGNPYAGSAFGKLIEAAPVEEALDL